MNKNANKKQKEEDGGDEVNMAIAEKRMRGVNIAKNLFGDAAASAAVACQVYDLVVDDDEEVEGENVAELGKARDISRELFGGASPGEAAEGALAVYEAVFCDDDQRGALADLQAACAIAKEVYGEASLATVLDIFVEKRPEDAEEQ